MTEVDRRNEIDLVLPGQTCWWQLNQKSGCYKLSDEEWMKINNVTEIVKPQPEVKNKSKLAK